MSPRRPTAPHAGAARARAARPPASGRAPSRPLPAAGPATRTTGKSRVGSRGRPPLIRPITMLSGVLVVLVLLLAPYVRPWVTQRSQIAEADERMRQLQQEVADLEAERQRWRDPAYVRAQARERLHFVMPGETGYVVLDDSAPASGAPDPRSVAAAVPSAGTPTSAHPWYGLVWDSIRLAGDPTTEQARSTRRPAP